VLTIRTHQKSKNPTGSENRVWRAGLQLFVFEQLISVVNSDKEIMKPENCRFKAYNQ